MLINVNIYYKNVYLYISLIPNLNYYKYHRLIAFYLFDVRGIIYE